MIEVRNLTKRYGSTLAVDDLSIEVVPGRVTGFLGPNGAGKSTTMRIVLGLDNPTSGRALIGGALYRSLPTPLRRVGALLDATAVHEGRTARAHLVALARSNGIVSRRLDEVVDLVGLTGVIGWRIGTYSLGMKQRLGIAAALLGDPEVLVLDEPINGLDTDGVRWIRTLLRGLADEGRTVLISSHVMSEMELTADHVVVIGRGRLIADAPLQDVLNTAAPPLTIVRTPHGGDLMALLATGGAHIERLGDDTWAVSGPTAAAIGDAAASNGWSLHELRAQTTSLEDAYTLMSRHAASLVAGAEDGGR